MSTEHREIGAHFLSTLDAPASVEAGAIFVFFKACQFL